MPREFADPYVYPGTDVLRNKPGLRDEGAWRTFEYERSARRATQLVEKPIPGKFDLDHLKAIHKHLFQHVYEWAGEIRTVNIRKDVIPFAPPAFIESYSDKLAADLANENPRDASRGQRRARAEREGTRSRAREIKGLGANDARRGRRGGRDETGVQS